MSRERSRALILLPFVAVLGAGLLVLGVLPGLAVTEDVVDGARNTLDQVGQLPEIDQPAERSQLVAADGSPMGWLAHTRNRLIVPLERIPEHVRHAVIATEDRKFYEHDGLDRRAIARALVANVRSGRIEEGASTITQQYVRSALLSNDVTLPRKITEAIYALRLEQRASKEEILEGYLNRVYFGKGAYGVQAAALRYYGRPLADLGLAQGAMLAGLIRNPSGNNPVDNPEPADARRDIVLDQMATAGFITEEQAREAQQVTYDPSQATRPTEPVYPFFTAWIQERLLQAPELGDSRAERSQRLLEGGLTIHTTLRPDHQRDAAEALGQRLDEPGQDPMGGIVSLSPDSGRVTAMTVGPKPWGPCPDRPEDCTTTTVNPLVPGVGSPGRQAGSAFKPFTAAAALEQGLDTDWEASTHQQPIEGCLGAGGDLWEPDNYSQASHGTVDMVEGLRSSINVYFAQLIAEVGPRTVAETAERLGLGGIPDRDVVCPLTLGTTGVYGLGMAQAYGTFGKGGVRCEPIGVTQVVGPDGEVVLENQRDCTRVISEDVAATMSTLLQNVIESGTGVAAGIGRPAAGKTGTTQDYRDAWFVGYTPQLSTAVWIGFEQPRPMRGVLGFSIVSGGTVPAATWGDYMAAVMEGMPVELLPERELDRYVPPAPEPPEPEETESPDDGATDESDDSDDDSPPNDDDSTNGGDDGSGSGDGDDGSGSDGSGGGSDDGGSGGSGDGSDGGGGDGGSGGSGQGGSGDSDGNG